MSVLDTFFLGVIAACLVVITIVLAVFFISVLGILRSLNQKSMAVSQELLEILPKLRRITSNVEELSTLLGIFSLFRKKN